MKTLLRKLHSGQHLNDAEAKTLIQKIISKEANEVQVASAITALIMRPISVNELNVFVNEILSYAEKPQLTFDKAIDVCGTGGDEKNTINISTLSAFIIAASGYKVIKHGNYGVSSFCGSSTVLEALGIKFTKESKKLQRMLDETNICFLHAPLFHPLLKNVAGVRKQLGLRSFFNYLGPLLNPVQPNFQLTGVYSQEVMRLYNQYFQNRREGYSIVHSLDGYDEVSLTNAFKIATNSCVKEFLPEDFGMKRIPAYAIKGKNSLHDVVYHFTEFLKGNGSDEQKNVVSFNAALGIKTLEKSLSMSEALDIAMTTINSGRGYKVLQAIKSLNHEYSE